MERVAEVMQADGSNAGVESSPVPTLRNALAYRVMYAKYFNI